MTMSTKLGDSKKSISGGVLRSKYSNPNRASMYPPEQLLYLYIVLML